MLYRNTVSSLPMSKENSILELLEEYGVMASQNISITSIISAYGHVVKFMGLESPKGYLVHACCIFILI